MPDKFKIDLTVFGELHAGPVFQSYAPGTTDQPSIFPSVSGISSLELVTNFPSIINQSVDLTLYAKVLAGGGNLTGSSTTHTSPLSGGSDRFDTARARLNIVGDTFGIEASVVASIQKIGLIIYGGVFPQEKFGIFNYDYNLLSCVFGKGEASCPVSILNTLDIQNWMNPLTGAVGPGIGAKWTSPFGLTLAAQMHSSWTPPVRPRADNADLNLRRTIVTGQINYNREDKVGETTINTSFAASYTFDHPAETLNGKGETLSPSHSVGLYAREGIGPCQVAAGYGFLTKEIASPELQISDNTHTLNLQAGCSVLKKRLFFSGGYTGVWYLTDEATSLVKSHTSAPEHALDLGIGGVPLPFEWAKGFSVAAGVTYLWADGSRQAVVGATTSRVNPYGILTYLRTFEALGGGK